MPTTTATVLGPGDGVHAQLGGLGVRFMIPGADTRGGFSLVEHPAAPRALAAPLHRHSREDEYSFVLKGRFGAQLGDEVVFASAGDLVYKPRGQWHTFWNAGDEPASLLEIIAPAGFEKFFAELAELFRTAGAKPDVIVPVAQRYGLDVDPSSIPLLCARHGLVFG